MSELEVRISRAIIKAALTKLYDLAETDVIIVGAGPAGLTAAYYLAKRGARTVVVEHRLSFGGGIGGGGSLLPAIVIDKTALDIVKEFDVKIRGEEEGLYLLDPAELMAKLASKAIDAGATILHGVHVEDVIFRTNPLRITGAVIKWYAIELAQLHVDPIFMYSKALIDATGHEAQVLRIVERKIPQANIRVRGEGSAYSTEGEKSVVEYTGRVIPGLYVAGMSVAALYGLPRMGPIFSSMLISGKRVAEIVAKDLGL